MSNVWIYILFGVLAILYIVGCVFGYKKAEENGLFDEKYYSSKGQLIFVKIWVALFGAIYLIINWIVDLVYKDKK